MLERLFNLLNGKESHEIIDKERIMFDRLVRAFEVAIKEEKKGIIIYVSEIAYEEMHFRICYGTDWYDRIFEKVYRDEGVVIKSNNDVLGIVVLPVEKLKKTEYFIEQCRKWSEFIDGPIEYI